MKSRLFLILLAACAAGAVRAENDRPSTNALTLVQSIPLPGVRGRIDHLALDVPGQALFVAALGNDTVEVIDLAAGQRRRSLGGCATPQGVAFVPGARRLFIANGGSGTVQIRDGESWEPIQSLGDLPDADNVRYDARADMIYVGYGAGVLGGIQARSGAPVARIPLPGHPEAFQLEQNGPRIFVNVPEARQVAVIDRAQRAVVATWPLDRFRANFPLALDESHQRVFVGCRQPARLVVLDAQTGRPVADLAVAGDVDDLWYDAVRRRLYLSCGEGFLDVVDQRDPDTYVLREHLATAPGARTALFAPGLGALYLAVPQRGKQPAEIRVYRAPR